MSHRFIEEVYLSTQGLLVSPIPGVEDAFVEDGPCDRMYKKMLDAYSRICARLGQENEDADVEIIINSLLSIQKELCFKMYEYGAKFGNAK